MTEACSRKQGADTRGNVDNGWLSTGEEVGSLDERTMGVLLRLAIGQGILAISVRSPSTTRGTASDTTKGVCDGQQDVDVVFYMRVEWCTARRLPAWARCDSGTGSAEEPSPRRLLR